MVSNAKVCRLMYAQLPMSDDLAHRAAFTCRNKFRHEALKNEYCHKCISGHALCQTIVQGPGHLCHAPEEQANLLSGALQPVGSAGVQLGNSCNNNQDRDGSLRPPLVQCLHTCVQLACQAWGFPSLITAIACAILHAEVHAGLQWNPALLADLRDAGMRRRPRWHQAL